MRKRFEQQLRIGQIAITDADIDLKSRDPYVAIMRALKEIFLTKDHNEKLFSILEDKILKGKKATGRPGMDLWQIFVLAQVRHGLCLSYDRLHTMANNDRLLRQVMGIETEFGYEKQKVEYQQILDNVSLLDDETVVKINGAICEVGHQVYKKKEVEALCLKTDSFVVGNNVHFPTDYNLLWDSGRKCLDIISYFTREYPEVKGWRKLNNWRVELKGKMRSLGRASVSGGKGKEDRMKKAARTYLVKARSLSIKLTLDKETLPMQNEKDFILLLELEGYMQMLNKHIDLVERRIIKGEAIPHQEKIFSIFEPYTEMIKKGKLHPNVELGKKVSITTDQYHLIIDYRIMEHESDSEIVIPTADKILTGFPVSSWSFDKGFYSKDNKEMLKLFIPHVVMPKRGKVNQAEKEEEGQHRFIKTKNKHSAVESNINELEHRGLDSCPDRGYAHFRRYVGLGVCAYNLRRIGVRLLENDRLAAHQQQAEKIRA
jgi:hypothetical protein